MKNEIIKSETTGGELTNLRGIHIIQSIHKAAALDTMTIDDFKKVVKFKFKSGRTPTEDDLLLMDQAAERLICMLK